MDTRTTPIEANCFYHIYNRGVNSEVIFRNDRNYLFFLEKIREHLLPVSEIYAFCLMPNHFHILVHIKSEEVLREVAQSQHSSVHIEEVGLHSPQHIFSKQFSRIFNSYSQAFNKETIGTVLSSNHLSKENIFHPRIIYGNVLFTSTRIQSARTSRSIHIHPLKRCSVQSQLRCAEKRYLNFLKINQTLWLVTCAIMTIISSCFSPSFLNLVKVLNLDKVSRTHT